MNDNACGLKTFRAQITWTSHYGKQLEAYVDGARTWGDFWRAITEGFANPGFFAFSMALGFGLAVLTHVAAGILADPIVRMDKKVWTRALGSNEPAESQQLVIVRRFRGQQFIPDFNYVFERRKRWLSKRSIIVQNSEKLFQWMLKFIIYVSPCLGIMATIIFIAYYNQDENVSWWGFIIFSVFSALAAMVGGVWLLGMTWAFLFMVPLIVCFLPLRFKIRAIRRRWLERSPLQA